MRTLSIFSLVALFSIASAQPTPAPVGPVAAAAPTKAKPTHVDFSIPLKPLKQKDLSFEMLKSRWSLLMYFSPTCGHCQHTFPYIRGFRDKFEKKGLAVAAIATGYASAEDIAVFDKDFNLDVMAFQDDTKKFSELYGTGSVPLIMLVAPDGTYQTWNASDSATIASMDSAIHKALKIK
jgi:thiol-disulfide isomerase/thioredoxin